MAEDTTGQPVTSAPAATPPVQVIQKSEATPPPVTPPSPPALGAKTILEGAEKTEKEVTPDWPSDWREKMAAYTVGKGDGGEYNKELKRLQRATSPLEINKSYRQLEVKYKRGDDPDPFPSEGTDEEKAAWRKSHSVPDKAEDYLKDFALPDGLVIGEADKPVVDEYLATAHEMNLPPNMVKNNIGWYFKTRDGQIQQRMEKDEQDKTSTAEELKAEFGPDFKKYLSAAYNLLETAPEGVLGALTEARMNDGTKLGNHPQVVRWLSQMALEINPAATVVPGSGENSMISIDTEMAQIEQLMKTNREAYWGDPSKQARYRELLEAKERLQKRNAA